MRSRSTCDAFYIEDSQTYTQSFNLRSEAAPHATYNKRVLQSVENCVSISDEKPLHMRRRAKTLNDRLQKVFQSQMRSRSTCDFKMGTMKKQSMGVSISDEKPLHMRRTGSRPQANSACSFNLR